jgi:hypothetical protein
VRAAADRVPAGTWIGYDVHDNLVDHVHDLVLDEQRGQARRQEAGHEEEKEVRATPRERQF